MKLGLIATCSAPIGFPPARAHASRRAGRPAASSSRRKSGTLSSAREPHMTQTRPPLPRGFSAPSRARSARGRKGSPTAATSAARVAAVIPGRSRSCSSRAAAKSAKRRSCRSSSPQMRWSSASGVCGFSCSAARSQSRFQQSAAVRSASTLNRQKLPKEPKRSARATGRGTFPSSAPIAVKRAANRRDRGASRQRTWCWTELAQPPIQPVSCWIAEVTRSRRLPSFKSAPRT